MTKKYSVQPIKGETLLDHLLFHRGIDSPEDREKFLNPDFERHSHDPYLMKGMEKAVARILKAFDDNEKIMIYSDYDADGIPGGVILHDFFKKIGFTNFSNYIPHRHDEGFGLNIEAVEQFSLDKIGLVITIDCGTADVKAVARADALGIDVIIADHHLPNGELPRAFAILNPKQTDCPYPEKMLCGAGVVFKLVQALISRLQTCQLLNLSTSKPTLGWEKWLLDMVGIATLSDMVPLTGENRVFAHFGLKVLRKSPRPGLMKLLSKLKINQRYLTEDDIAFMITPRINAASRMGMPMDAFNLLATSDETTAVVHADHLDKINNERKGVVASMMKEMKQSVLTRYKEEKKVIVLGNPKWKPALLGLAAGNLAEEHSCPVFLWGRDGEMTLKGSCRSGGGVNVVELMRKADVFLEFGGHAMAGGFSVANERVHLMEQELETAYEKIRQEQLASTDNSKVIVDGELSIENVDEKLWTQVEQLGPFGVGNPKPIFILKNVSPALVRQFGKEKNHLELSFEKPNGKKISAIAFFKNTESWGGEVKESKPIDLIATVEKSMFRGFAEIRLRIVDIIC